MVIDTTITKMLDLKLSTTKFLESIANDILKVKINHQFEKDLAIERDTFLFFKNYDNPVIWSVSILDRSCLTDIEYHLLMNSDLPIGRIFNDVKSETYLNKSNIDIVMGEHEIASSRLNINSSIVFEKKYDLIVANRKIGVITEFFNEESLARL